MADDSKPVVSEGGVDSISDNYELSANCFGISSTSGNGNEAESLDCISVERNIDEDVEESNCCAGVNVVDTNEVTTTMEQVSSRSNCENNEELRSFKIPHFTEVRPVVQKRAESSCTVKSVVTSSESPLKCGTSSTSNSVSGSQDSGSIKAHEASTTVQSKDISLLPYTEPFWGGIAKAVYNFEILKNGCVIGKVDLNSKSFYIVGRLPVCDVVLEHPSLSRFHAIIQYREQEDENYDAGFYLFDLESTHGTYLNKNKVKPKTYYRLHVGHFVKFGGSSRLFVLQGPADDQEAESELSVTELKELQRKKREEALHKAHDDTDHNVDRLPDEGDKDEVEDSGIDWGFGEDAIDDEVTENPFAVLDEVEHGKELDLQDPKKTLRGFFEREGYDLEYDVTEEGFGHSRHLRCRVRLPIENSSGELIYAESVVSGKKKEAIAACALEACRILDSHGLLRQAIHESRKRKKKNWEEDDYYDSDEDTYLDRTGTIEKKRMQRIRQSGKEDHAETYTSLTKKCEVIQREIDQVHSRLLQAAEQRNEVAGDDDELDIYMSNVKAGRILDKKDQIKLKLQLLDLQKEEQRLQRLISFAKPTALPELNVNTASTSGFNIKKSSEVSSTSNRKTLPLTGSMKGYGKNKLRLNQKSSKVPSSVEAAVSSSSTGVLEEEEEDELNSDLSNISCIKSSTDCMEVDNGYHEDNGGVADSSDDFNAEGPDQSSEIPSYFLENEAQQTVPSFNSGDCDDNEVDSDELPQTLSLDSFKKKITTVFSDEDVLGTEYDASNPDYAMWLPPEDQDGDGRTKLNDKYGY